MQEFTYQNYGFLKDLGIEESNLGAYFDGKFCGEGNEQISLNPSNGKPIAKITLASDSDYHKAI